MGVEPIPEPKELFYRYNYSEESPLLCFLPERISNMEVSSLTVNEPTLKHFLKVIFSF